MSQKNQQKASPGVLAINPAATQKAAPPPTPKGHSSKGNAPRLKLHVRRLPPGLTQAEFETTLGDCWKVGRGKVDWFLFKEGKVSTDPSKPSRPGRAYLRVTSSVTIPELSDVIRQTTFHDARNTYNDSALLGPPTLEYAPFSRVPSGKVRNDARVGTIDQDAEFIAFLESLTNPVTKPSEEETTEAADKVEKPTITPLIQYLREKKANKAKEVAAAKAAKQARSAAAKESKSEKSIGKKQLLSRADKSTSEKQKKDKAAKDVAVKDAVKAANKQAANGSAKAENKALASSVNQPSQASPAPERKRERGSLTAATKILRRDLGLTTPTRRRDKAGQASSSGPGGNATAESAKKDQQPSSSKLESDNPAPTPKGKNAADSTPKSAPSKQPKGTPPAEPAAARNNAAGKKAATTPSTPNTKASSTPAAQKSQQQSSQSPSSNGTQAFLKHANPSQGVTEDLLQKGFSQFGKVIRVEIDKKKGFGYVDFAEPASLRKAIDASPVSIAQSQVVVLERRTSAAVAQNRGHGNRGAGTGGGGGGGAGQGPTHANTQQQPSQQGSRPAQAGSSPTAAAAPPPTTSPASRGTPGPRGRGSRRGYGRGGAGGRGK